MPNVGDVETKFGRKYMFLNPDPMQGPGAWRLSHPDEYPGGPGGPGGGGIADIDGIPPIVASQDVTGATEVSMDITKLDDRQS